jgi:hypothetical protein
VPDPTQPVPGPTRQQVAETWAERARSATTEILDPEEVARIRQAGPGHRAAGQALSLLADSHEALRALLSARPSRCGFMSLGRQCQLPSVHDGEDHKLDLTEPARPSPTDDDLSAEIAEFWAAFTVGENVLRDIVTAAAGMSDGANPTAAGRFADALARELDARGLEIRARPTGGTT